MRLKRLSGYEIAGAAGFVLALVFALIVARVGL